MYDSNETMRKLGEQTAEIIASKEVREEIIDVLKAHSVRYSADIKDIMHLAVDLYALGYARGKGFFESGTS